MCNWTVIFRERDTYEGISGTRYWIYLRQTARAARRKHRELLKQGVDSLGIRCTRHVAYASSWFVPDEDENPRR